MQRFNLTAKTLKYVKCNNGNTCGQKWSPTGSALWYNKNNLTKDPHLCIIYSIPLFSD